MFNRALYIFIFIQILSSTQIFGAGKDSIIAITKTDFDKGRPLDTMLFKDKSIFKEGAQLLISKACKVFKDDSSDENFREYNYIGDLDRAFRFKVLQKIGYNGFDYYIFDIKRNCSSYHLLGRPQFFGGFIINLNESEATDKKYLIEIWKRNSEGLKKIRTVNLKNPPSIEIDPVELKISQERKTLIKDSNSKYGRWNGVCRCQFI